MVEGRQQQISLLEKWQNWMDLIQKQTGIKGIYVVIGLIISVILVYFNIFDSIITNLVGTLYPAFWTIKSIEKNYTVEQKNWLTYWAVFAFFVLIDMFSPIIVKFVPFYLVLKILFLIWMFMPGFYGCNFIYNKIVKKIFQKYEKILDELLKDAEEVLINDDNKKKRLYKKNSHKINMDEINKTVLEIKKKEKEEEKEKEEKELEKEKEEKEKEKEKEKKDNMQEKEKFE